MHIILSRLDSIELDLHGQKVPISFSWGVAQYQVGDTPETIIRRADERLYAAKAKRPWLPHTKTRLAIAPNPT